MYMYNGVLNVKSMCVKEIYVFFVSIVIWFEMNYVYVVLYKVIIINK